MLFSDRLFHLVLFTSLASTVFQSTVFAMQPNQTLSQAHPLGQLIEAAGTGNSTMVDHLIANGANVDEANFYGVTPLHWAAKGGHNEITQALLAAGAQVNRTENFGATPLHYVPLKGNNQVAETLIAAGANVNHASNSGHTPLHTAAIAGRNQIVETLIAAGANVNHTTNSGATPLHLAARGGHNQVVETLIAAGANVNQTNHDGATPLLMAAEMGQDQVVQTLLVKGADKKVVNLNNVTYPTAKLLIKVGALRLKQLPERLKADIGQNELEKLLSQGRAARVLRKVEAAYLSEGKKAANEEALYRLTKHFGEAGVKVAFRDEQTNGFECPDASTNFENKWVRAKAQRRSNSVSSERTMRQSSTIRSRSR